MNKLKFINAAETVSVQGNSEVRPAEEPSVTRLEISTINCKLHNDSRL